VSPTSRGQITVILRRKISKRFGSLGYVTVTALLVIPILLVI